MIDQYTAHQGDDYVEVYCPSKATLSMRDPDDADRAEVTAMVATLNAAPDMLAVLEAIMDYGLRPPSLKAARAAILKARGQ